MDAFAEVAESIIEHAEALARLDRRVLPAAAFRARMDEHVRAIRVLAAPHLHGRVDRVFLKALQREATRADGVFVHLPDTAVEFLVDAPGGRLRFELWTPAQLREDRA